MTLLKRKLDACATMRRELNHFLTSSWIQWCGSALVWLVVAAIVTQMVIPPRLAALDWIADQEQSEGEESEPAESSGEEELPQLCSASFRRIRLRDVAVWQQFVSAGVGIHQRSIVRSLIPAEFVCRNGSGGPLRC
jgi:p-aminobenzoyl-glutamate transporter AbgT